MPSKTVVQLLGLGQRAGQVVSGDFIVRVKIRKRAAHLIILAADAASQTIKDFQRYARGAGIPVVVYGRKIELGAALGRPPRAVVAVLDEVLAKRILKLIEGGER